MLWDAYPKGWLDWAGPPENSIKYNDRGLIVKGPLQRLSHSGLFFDTRFEMETRRLEESIGQTTPLLVAHLFFPKMLRLAPDTQLLAITGVLNRHLNEPGVSPSILLSGQGVKLYSEILQDGRPHMSYPDVGEAGSP